MVLSSGGQRKRLLKNAAIVLLVFALPVAALVNEELWTRVSGEAQYEINITGFGFVPQMLFIQKGDTIRWINLEPVSDTLLFTFVSNGSVYLLSDLIPANTPYFPNASWTHTFNDVVEIQYSSHNIPEISAFLTVLPSNARFISVQSEFSGYFLKNLHFVNTFGVYTSLSGASPVEVYGAIGGIQYPFSPPSKAGGSYNLTVDMGSLTPDFALPGWPSYTLVVFAVYSNGIVLNESYSLQVIETPSWLMSVLNNAGVVHVEKEKLGDWNNTYAVHIEKEFGLSNIFNVTIPLPKFAGGGNYTLLPSVEVEFSFYSTGSFTISTPFTLETPEMEFGVATAQARVKISVSGEFNLQNNTIVWVSATLTLDVGANCKVHVPIAGYTFHVPVIGDTTIGLSATVIIDANFAASIALAPTENTSQELIPGLGVMIQSITGQISFDVDLAVNCGIGIASISGGGSVNFVVSLKPEKPYISGGVVTGAVYIKWHVLFWQGTLWSMSGTLYEWHSPGRMNPYINPDTSNYTLTPRYYNTADYEGFVWTNGSWNGVAVQDMYPFTRTSAVSYGDSAYILYATDNVSVPQESGLCLTGLEFNSSQRTLGRFVMPPFADEICFDPVVISLPDGTLLAMWDSVPFSVMNNATPFEINRIILRYSYFDPQTRSWSPIRNLTETGIATSHSLSSDSTAPYALIFQGDSIFSTTQNLIEYNLQSGLELLNMSVANISKIISFNHFSHVAVLQLIDGSYELLNLTSRELVSIPPMSACEMKDVQLAMNSSDSLGVLYSNSTSSIFAIYKIPSSTLNFSMNVSRSTSHFRLIQAERGYHLIACDSSGIMSYLIAHQSVEPSVLYPIENITSMGATITEDGVLVYTTENYGNSSYPLLNLTLTLIPKLPSLLILSPENRTYNVGNIPLDFEVDRTASWMGYRLDGQPNVTITGNATLTSLHDGLHSLIVYANDTFDNMGASNMVSFVIDTTPPNITDVLQTPSTNNVGPQDTVRISAIVSDAMSMVEQVILNYTSGNGTWTAVTMINLEGDTWNASIPAFPYGTYANYTIAAEDSANNSITTEEALGYQYQYYVIPEFPSPLIPSLFMAVILLVVMIRRRHVR